MRGWKSALHVSRRHVLSLALATSSNMLCVLEEAFAIVEHFCPVAFGFESDEICSSTLSQGCAPSWIQMHSSEVNFIATAA